MENQQAFIDEFGNSDLNISQTGATSHFIVSAVIVNRIRVAEVEAQVEPIRKKYFQTGPIKSSNVAGNIRRRKRILKDLAATDIHVYALVVDKSRLYSNGFTYKPSFYKYLHRIVDRELSIAFPRLAISTDEYGSKEFMSGFVEYLRRTHPPDLFNQYEFGFVKSRSILMIQVADFICGSIARYYEKSMKSSASQEIMELLKPIMLSIREWPLPTRPRNIDSLTDITSEQDRIIANQGFGLAYDFIENHKPDNGPIRDQLNCLKYLLFHYFYIDARSYVPTFDIIRNIQHFTNQSISRYYFRSQVIAKLRDAGVLISSSPKGYKIPCRLIDIYDFVDHSATIITPMIERVRLCREKIILSTKGIIDVLDKPEYVVLKQYLNGRSTEVPNTES